MRRGRLSALSLPPLEDVRGHAVPSLGFFPRVFEQLLIRHAFRRQPALERLGQRFSMDERGLAGPSPAPGLGRRTTRRTVGVRR
jgi:hypothetical protein